MEKGIDKLEDSLPKLADNLVLRTNKLLKEARTEEDLRIGFEKLLDPIKGELGIRSEAKYESSTTYRGRTDAVHGSVIIEYESPQSFSSRKKVAQARSQLVDYLCGEAKESRLSKLVGVGFDGEQIFFVQYQDKEDRKIDATKFSVRGPYEFNADSARTFLFHLRALSRLPLTAENLAQKFGPQSELAPKMVSALANALEHWGDQVHIRTFFDEWKRLFGIVYGEQFNNHQKKEAEEISRIYRVGRETDLQELLFCVHTYFAFLMKIIAAELLTLRETSFGSSLAAQLSHIPEDEFRSKLEDIENGGIYARKGITNFLEGDFFRWYLDAFDSPELKDSIREIARALADFEPATSTLVPVSTQDLLKKLYQYLVPQAVRQRLGEYYTPNWLAEFLLKEIGYDGNTAKRFLDPACGSGTFLVLAIHCAKENGIKEKWPQLEIAKRIVNNIWGFDLNPLAVIAARTNYLFAMGDLVNELQHFEIPIYLADSVLWPEHFGSQGEINFHGDHIKVRTSVKEFHVPSIWVRDKGFLMKDAALMIEKFAKDEFEAEEALKHLRDKGLVFPPHEKIVKTFYREILELERERKNGIWARFLKNAFAPMVAGKFDYVVGNPPWIRWGYLSKEYRQATLPLWKDYGLFSLKGQAARLGGGEKDFSMLFTYAAADYYLKDGARLGFLITQEVFKSKGAGEGFRKFRIGEDGKHLKVLKAHDLITVQPFEGAANKTASIIFTKGKPTKYPIPYTVWGRKKGIGKIPTDITLHDSLKLLKKEKLWARPIGKPNGSWQTIQNKQKTLSSIEGKNAYLAKLGARVEPYGVFWLEVNRVLSDGNLVVRNLTERGKRHIRQIEEVIEPDLVYPALTGGAIERWGTLPNIYILMSQNPAISEPYPEQEMKSKWPRTYIYLTKFKDVLLSRGSNTVRRFAERTAFYAMFGIGPYTIANFKVVWKRMANDLIATVISQYKSPFGYKTVIPTDTTSLFATNNENEAHYLCAIANSKPVRDFIKSFSSAGRGFGTPSVMEHVGIPKFDPRNSLHQKLAKISQECHRLKSDGKEKEIERLEQENDALVGKLFGIK